MTRKKTISIIKKYLLKYPIKEVGIFGSFARKEEQSDSDIDILVSFKETIDLFQLVAIHQDLAELLGRKVDIVTDKALHPALEKYVYKDLQIIAVA